MADGNDEGGGAVGAGQQRVRVNGRRVDLDLTTGEILSGPKAIVGKFICGEQVADVVEAGDYGGRLCTADRPEDLRLAEAEYRFLRPKERDVTTPLERNIHVTYGNHGTFKVVDWAGGGAQTVVLEAADGKRLTIPMQRYLHETEVTTAPPTVATTQQGAQPDPYRKIEGEGNIEVDDAEIIGLIESHMDKLLESDAFVARIVEAVGERLATTLEQAGQNPVGDVHEDDDDGASPT